MASGLGEFEAHSSSSQRRSRPSTIHNRGLAYATPEVQARIEAGAPVSPNETYCRVMPSFEVPAGPHEWMARTIFVGTGERRGAQSVFDYYAVT